MKNIFRHRILGAIGITIAFATILLLLRGEIELGLLTAVFVGACIVLSYPGLVERYWQQKNLPPDTIHVPTRTIRKGNDFDLLALFDQPEIYQLIKRRYSLRTGDPAAAGLFLYIYLPTWLYENRNAGAQAVYGRLAEKLKEDVGERVDLDLITQRNLPLAFGFRFLPKNGFVFHELSNVMDVVKKDYFRENTRIRGILQSKKRLFRLHSPDDGEWRTFQPFQDDSKILYGGGLLAHDFRANGRRHLLLTQVHEIEAERVDYTEMIPFGTLLTYAKKGEVTLQDQPEATDKLYIDRINVLVHGSEHRREILEQLSRALKRDLTPDDLYPLFNYGQKLRGYLPTGKNLSDFVSSRGNFALYYDEERGWTVIRLAPQLELRLLEAYWSHEPKRINDAVSLTTSRASLITGSPDSLLQFQITTGTPTRGQILAADELIENKIKSFAQIFGFQLDRAIGTGAEGCVFLAAKNGKRFYLKSPDGQLAEEEIETIEALKSHRLIPGDIRAYREDRMIVMPEFKNLPQWLNGQNRASFSLLFEYVRKVYESGYICLDLTPEHVKMKTEEERMFLIDFSGYAKAASFQQHPLEFLADRKKIEYRTPEEFSKNFDEPEKFQIYLLGLLMYQLAREDMSLPLALKSIQDGAPHYQAVLAEDLKSIHTGLESVLEEMLDYDPKQRKSFAALENFFRTSPDEVRQFWQTVRS